MNYNKLKIARDVLSKNQDDIANETGRTQTIVSAIETGRRKELPIWYIEYLNKNGINLAALFDDSISVEGFRQACLQKTQSFCSACKVKDDKIALLERLVSSKDDYITSLRNGTLKISSH